MVNYVELIVGVRNQMAEGATFLAWKLEVI